jgi:hypothetical protein
MILVAVIMQGRHLADGNRYGDKRALALYDFRRYKQW